MKKEIMAYLEGAIASSTNLLNFVADITEEIQSPENEEIIERYLKRISELEESCENMCEVEKNLQKRIDKLTGPTRVQD